MKIWVIGRNFPTKQNNLSGSFELEQAQIISRLGKRNHEIAYIAAVFHPYKKIKKWGYCSFHDKDISVYTESVPFFPDRFHVHMKSFRRKVWMRLLHNVESEMGVPDIIHIHYPAIVALPDAIAEYQKKGSKIVITEHWSKVLNKTINHYQKQQLQQFVQYADRVVCVGRPLKKAIREITGIEREIIVIPNVVSSMFNSYHAKDKGKNFRFVVVGRLEPEKQIDQTVVAFSKAFAGQDNIGLDIVGNGSEKGRIETIIRDAHIEKQVIMHGTLTREETAEKIENADVLICFSRYETFGVTAIEGWACGKPAIITKSMGVVEYWTDGLGLIVHHDKLDELIEAMKNIYNNISEYDSEKIAEYARDHFGEKAIYNQLMEVYCNN